MSAKTDDALQSIQNIIAFGMPHKDHMYAVQGYCDMLKKEIAELEAERDALKESVSNNAVEPELRPLNDSEKKEMLEWLKEIRNEHCT